MIDGAGGGSRNVTATQPGTVTWGSGVTLRTGAGLGTAAVNVGGANMTLESSATIQSAIAGRTIILNPASFTNHGTVEVMPGAAITVNGNYTQTATGTFLAHVAGLLATQFGRMNVAGTAFLDGTFAVVEDNGFQLDCFNSFDFITAGTLSGEFDTITLPPPSNYVHIPQVLYVDGVVRLYIKHLADFNNDGSLNADDLGDFINAYFGGQADITDFNGDGSVNADDLGDYINAYFTPC